MNWSLGFFGHGTDRNGAVDALKETDDRVQQLFDNCFEGIGCSDPLALNFDEGAIFDFDGACSYPALLCGESLTSAYQDYYATPFLVNDSIAIFVWGINFGSCARATTRETMRPLWGRWACLWGLPLQTQ